MVDPSAPYTPPQTSEAFRSIAARFTDKGNHARQELLGWVLLGITVLALAGIMALLVAVSRIPGIEKLSLWPIDFFQKGLVVHVIFSFMVWFFAVFGALLCIGSTQPSLQKQKGLNIGTLIVWAAVVASLLLALPAFFGNNAASLNNYVPTIIDPVFYIGLTILGLALVVQTLRFLISQFSHRDYRSPFEFMICLAALLFVIAFVCLVSAGVQLLGGKIDQEFNENLFWGFGHLLQFTNVALLIGAWAYLANSCGLNIASAYIKIAGATLLLAALVAPFFYSFFEPFSAAQTLAFTNLQYTFAPVTGIILFAVFISFLRDRKSCPWHDPAFLSLILSITVFCIGGFLGLFVDGADTRTPAHYHGVIAGINLAFMGLYYTLFLPLLDKAVVISKSIYLQLGLFAGGQTLAAIGLFLAGGYGAPRKVAGADQGLDAIGGYAGMMMNGVGALIAIIGGILFIWSMARALLKQPHSQ